MNAPDSDAAAARAAFRAFVRAHHPDVGGDPEIFAAGLAELRAARARPIPARATDRYDAPIVYVSRPTGLRGLTRRFHEWRARRRCGPRVV